MKGFLYTFVALCLVAERDGFFERKVETPLRWVGKLLFETKFVVIPVVDVCIVLLLFGSIAVARRPDPMLKAIYASLAALAVAAVWGLLNGGSAYHTQFQVHSLVVSLLFALAIRRVLSSPEDYVTLGKVIAGAALYRALSIVVYWLVVLRPSGASELPHVITSHDDSVLFAGAFAGLVVHAFVRPSARSLRNAFVIGGLIVLAIYFNNRRIAYLGLFAALGVCHLALPPSPLKQRIDRRLGLLAPLVLLYIVVGWGRTEPIFKPLASLSSVSSEETDASAKSRENENMGLVVTFGRSPWLGTGWGHEFVEVDDTLAPKQFAQYRYLPHNSVLGVLAFSGMLGFAATWMIFPLCALYAARGIRQARSPTVRLLGLGTMSLVVVCMLQAWGDMGLLCYAPTFLMAAAVACASHLPSFEAMAYAPVAVRSAPDACAATSAHLNA